MLSRTSSKLLFIGMPRASSHSSQGGHDASRYLAMLRVLSLFDIDRQYRISDIHIYGLCMGIVTQIIDISIYSDTINYILKDIQVVQFNCLCNLWLYVKLNGPCSVMYHQTCVQWLYSYAHVNGIVILCLYELQYTCALTWSFNYFVSSVSILSPPIYPIEFSLISIRGNSRNSSSHTIISQL